MARAFQSPHRTRAEPNPQSRGGHGATREGGLMPADAAQRRVTPGTPATRRGATGGLARGSRPVVVDVTIKELALGGSGVGIVETSAGASGERRAVFVGGTAPGDRVRVRADLTKRPARGELLQLLEAGPSRVEAACAVAGRCGGCDWMHVEPATRRATYEAHVRSVLPEPWRATPIAFHATDEALGQRARARLHVRGSGGRVLVGMNEARSHEPVEVASCVVLHPALEAARAALGPLLEGAHGRGDAQLALGTTIDAGGAPVHPDGAAVKPVLDLTWSGALPAAVFGRIEAAVARGEWAGIRVTQGESTRPAIVGDPTPWLAGADGMPLRLAPGGFAQPSQAGNTRLGTLVMDLSRKAASGSLAETRVTELYAGAGNFTVLLAREAREVVAVELHGAACKAARENLAARGLKAKFVEADAASFAYPAATQLLVLDPPRAGARSVAERLQTHPVRHVLYVSCDPPTLGRDLAIMLAAGYELRHLALVEMFPMTSHVETVALLERPKGAAAVKRPQ